MNELFDAILEGFIKTQAISRRVETMDEFEAREADRALDEEMERDEWHAWQEEKNLEFYAAREIDWKIDEMQEREAF